MQRAVEAAKKGRLQVEEVERVLGGQGRELEDELARARSEAQGDGIKGDALVEKVQRVKFAFSLAEARRSMGVPG